MAAGWGLSLEPTQSLAALWRAVTDRLIEYRYQQLEAVVLLDDADQADPSVLQHVTRLVRFDPSPETRLTIVLAGRNEGMAEAVASRCWNWSICGSTWSRGSRPIRRSSCHAAGPSRAAVARVCRAGRGPLARTVPRHSPPRLPTGRPGAVGRGRQRTPADRRRGGRRGLPRVGPRWFHLRCSVLGAADARDTIGGDRQ